MTSDTPPLVSIVIVAHNHWPELELAIESALGQSWPTTEVLVIDNDSRDATSVEVPRLYSGRVRYIRQPNTLDGGGYNRGISESKGEYVQLLDGDDLLAPNKIARQMEVFTARADAGIVYGDARQFQAVAGTPDWSDWDTGPQEDMLATLIDPAGEGAGLVIHSALFRRRVLDNVGPWDESLVGADFDYWLRAAWAGCVFVYSPGAWCFHRRGPAQMSANGAVMYDRTLKTLDKALGYVTREPYRSAIRRRLAGLRYANALTNLSLDRASAKRELVAARELDPRRISMLPYAAASVALSIPGMRRAMKARALGRMRALAGRRMGVLEG